MSRGFSLVEMVVAVALVLVALGAVFTLANPAHPTFQAQPVAIDMQQRTRVAVDAISGDLLAAGAGLGKYVAPVLPFRRGLISPDSPGSFFTDRISVLYVPPKTATTTLNAPSDAGSVVYVNAQPGCSLAKPLCGFVVNTLAAVFDETGTYDTFRIASLQENPPAIVRHPGPWSKAYAAGATLTAIESVTYWLRIDTGKGTSELMRYDGRVTDLPVADEVVGLTFEYFGDPTPPVIRRPPSDPVGPWTSYGPKTPPVTDDDAATDGYGAGENCVFNVVEAATAPRLSILGLPPSLVPLPSSSLTDGPWCPDHLAPNRFDADLLRVRRVRVMLRVRPSATVVQTPTPDQQISFDVVPRNLSLPQ